MGFKEFLQARLTHYQRNVVQNKPRGSRAWIDRLDTKSNLPGFPITEAQMIFTQNVKFI